MVCHGIFGSVFQDFAGFGRILKIQHFFWQNYSLTRNFEFQDNSKFCRQNLEIQNFDDKIMNFQDFAVQYSFSNPPP